MSLARASCLLLIAVLGSCGGALPNSAISRHLAIRFKGAENYATPVAKVIHDRGLHVPDMQSGAPPLEQLQAELAKSDPDGTFAGVTYDLTSGNSLPRDWIVQTPNNWGRRANDLPPGHSDWLVWMIRDLVASAQRRVDITLLTPPPDARFLDGLRDGLRLLAEGGRPVTVRLLIGHYPTEEADTGAFLKALTNGLESIPNAHLSVSVAAMRSCVVFEDCDSYSWNHAKTISVDGVDALVGGHNMYTQDYLLDDPVHDLSMRVHGPAAASAARYSDRLWDYVCANLDRKPSISVSTFVSGVGQSGTGCLPPPPPLPTAKPTTKTTGGVPILAVARLGAGITKDFANQSELARDLMLGAARSDIRIVQQDLGFALGRSDTLFPDSTIDRLVDFLRRRDGDIYIVLSNQGAVGKSGSTYSNDVSLQTLAHHIREAVERRFEARDPHWRYQIRTGPDPVNALLCERLHLALFRFGPDKRWPDGMPFATHTKFWMVDDRVFYIGSDNMYPVNLQEFGYIVDDRQAAQELIDAYWTPLWQWSSRAAVSGRGVKNCIFREIIK
jgi:phosphatidylserine/phosphatidylglycerophosphate/cardiolipin synthase-like enzyme